MHFTQKIETFFKIRERKSSIETEFLAGTTVFMTMAYILAVNPAILAECGMDASSVFVATALSTAIASCIMGLLANFPIALAPGMGLNAFFAFNIVLGMGHTWQFALTAVFLEGIIFTILTITHVRTAILNAIPKVLNSGISVGIGLFIAFIGLQSMGLVTSNEQTILEINNFMNKETILALIGLTISVFLIVYRTRGALLISIILTTLIGVTFGITDLSGFDIRQFFNIPSVAPTFLQFEWDNIFTYDMLIIVITMLFMDIFDTVGTLLAVTTKANLLNEDGTMPNAREAFLADSLGTTVGAMLGTSTVTDYVESVSGVAEGGRTGLTAIVVAFFFLISLFFAPLFLIIPSAATAPALVIVGLFMTSTIKNIDFKNYRESIPAFLAIIITPFASIPDGLFFAIISYVIINIFHRKTKNISPIVIILAIIFLLQYIL